MSQQLQPKNASQNKSYVRRTTKAPNSKIMRIITSGGYGLTLMVIILFMLNDVVFRI